MFSMHLLAYCNSISGSQGGYSGGGGSSGGGKTYTAFQSTNYISNTVFLFGDVVGMKIKANLPKLLANKSFLTLNFEKHNLPKKVN